MAETFVAEVTTDQLIKLLKDGFAGGLVDTLKKEMMSKIKSDMNTQMNKQLADIEKMIEAQVRKVVEGYSAHVTRIYNSSTCQPVFNITIQPKRGPHE